MRKLLGFAFAALCMTAAPAFALDCEDGFRAFVHHGGETCIPEKPARIVAPRGDSVATPLMDIGAPVIGVGFRTMDDGSSYVRGASDIFGSDFVDGYGLTSVGNPNQFDIEAVASLEPDLIILNAWQAENSEKTDLIAPTIVVQPNLPFLDHLAFLADAAGMKGVYEQRLAGYEAKIAKVKETLGDPSKVSVSRLDLWDDGLWYYPNWGAIDQVINDVGFGKPDAQANATENLSGYSFEHLPDFDGDIIISSRAPRFGQTIEMLEDQWDTVAPFWRELNGVKSGGHYWYERDVWVGYTFKSLETAADGLLLLTAGRMPGDI